MAGLAGIEPVILAISTYAETVMFCPAFMVSAEHKAGDCVNVVVEEMAAGLMGTPAAAH